MASGILFIVISIIAAILLFITGLTATFGAEDTLKSVLYNSESKIRSAHQCLTIAAGLGWSGMIMLIITLIIAGVTTGYSVNNVVQEILKLQI